MKQIKLYAYLENNLGDDLMVDILLKKYPQYLFWYDGESQSSSCFLKYPNFINRIAYWQKYGRFNHLLNVLTLNRRRDFFLQYLFDKQTSKCCCSVYIGGSLFMQRKGENIAARMTVEKKKLEKKPLFVIGANFGPYYSQNFKDEFADFFSECGGVTFRDKASVTLFNSLNNIAYAPDVVFNCPANAVVSHEREHIVLISVLDVRGRKSLIEWADVYEQFIIKVCDACINRGQVPILMSFCEAEGDMKGIERILDRMDASRKENTRVFSYHGNLEEALGLFQKASFVIATRFHAMILAIRFQIPFFGISYNYKIKNVLDDLDCDAYSELSNLNNLSPDCIFEKYREPFCATEYIDRAIHQFDQFEGYIKKYEE